MSETKGKLQQESMAALLDNELPATQINELSQAINRDPELRQQLARHQMISCALKAEHINLNALNLVDSVSERLKDEPTVLAPTARWRNTHRWIQPLAGSALAASVAALGIAFGPQLLMQDPVVPNPGIQVVAQPVTVSPPQEAQEQHWKTLQPQDSQELTPYLQDHSEYAVQGVMPYASYVSYDERKR